MDSLRGLLIMAAPQQGFAVGRLVSLLSFIPISWLGSPGAKHFIREPVIEK